MKLKRCIGLMLACCMGMSVAALAQPKLSNIYEIGRGEIFTKKYVFLQYLYNGWLVAVPATEGIDDYSWENLAGVIDFNERVLVPFKYRNIRLLENFNGDDAVMKHRLVTVSEGKLPRLYELSKDGLLPLADFEGFTFNYMPENNRFVFTSSGMINYIFNLKNGQAIPVGLGLRYALNKSLLCFRSNHKDGVADLQGRVVVPARYYRILPLGESFMWVEKGEKGDSIGIFDREAQVLLPPVFSQIERGRNRFFARTFHHGTPLTLSDEVISGVSDWTARWNKSKKRMYSLTQKQIQQLGLMGAFDLKGQLVIPFEYDYLEKGIGTEIIADKKGAKGIVSEKGQVMVPFQYQQIEAAFNRLYVVSNDGKYGLLGSKGKVILPCLYDSIFVLDADRALVLNEEKWFLWKRKTGEMTSTDWIKEYQFDYLKTSPYYSGDDEAEQADRNTCFILKRNNCYGIIDKELKTVIPPIHDEEPVYYWNKSFIFDIYRKPILYTRKGVRLKGLNPIDYANESSLFPNTLICMSDGKYGVVDMDGKTIIPFTYSQIDNIDGTRFVVKYF